MEYRYSFYKIDPDNPILTNLLGFLGEYMMEGILGRFNPFDTAEMFFRELRFDPKEMLAFEDLTWDTVFANLKTLEFEASCSESDDPRMDMGYYMHFADMIHDLDADTLNRGLAPELQAMGGWISSEIVKIFMERLEEALQGKDFKKSAQELINSIPSMVRDVLLQYLGSERETIPAIESLFREMDSVFEKVEYDELGGFKLGYAAVIKGTEVLVCNPEYLQLGDRIKSAVKFYLSGFAFALGTKISEKISVDKFEVIEKFAPDLVAYLPTLISTLITYVTIFSLDRNSQICSLIAQFNEIPTITGNIALYRKSADAFEHMAAELSKINYEDLKAQVDFYSGFSAELTRIRSDEEMNRFLLKYYRDNNKELPWGNRSLKEHWADKNSRLVFK